MYGVVQQPAELRFDRHCGNLEPHGGLSHPAPDRKKLRRRVHLIVPLHSSIHNYKTVIRQRGSMIRPTRSQPSPSSMIMKAQPRGWPIGRLSMVAPPSRYP